MHQPRLPGACPERRCSHDVATRGSRRREHIKRGGRNGRTHLRQIHILPAPITKHTPALDLYPPSILDRLHAAHARPRPRPLRRRAPRLARPRRLLALERLRRTRRAVLEGTAPSRSSPPPPRPASAGGPAPTPSTATSVVPMGRESSGCGRECSVQRSGVPSGPRRRWVTRGPRAALIACRAGRTRLPAHARDRRLIGPPTPAIPAREESPDSWRRSR